MGHDFYKDQKFGKSLKLSLIDGLLYSIMVGAGESYLPAYALSLGYSEVAAGVLTSLPLITGAFLQLFTPALVQKTKKPKRWMVLSAALQAMIFLPLIYFETHHRPNFWILILIFTLYWTSGFSINPYWTHWMNHLVPDAIKNQYFSLRSRVAQIGVLIGLVGGGLSLHYKVEIGPFSGVFTFLFLLAFVCRIISSFVLSQKEYVVDWDSTVTKEQVSFRDYYNFIMSGSEASRFILSLFPFYACVYISSPFVAPFFLSHVKLDYSDYMGALIALLFGKILGALFLERIGKTWDSKQIFFWGVFLISPGPMFWGLSKNYLFILGLQFVSGFAWAFYEVGTQLLLFKNQNIKNRISFVSLYNFVMSVAVILGTFIGASFIRNFSPTYQNFITLFLLGGFLRVVFSANLLRKVMLRETRMTDEQAR
ncbi:MAG: MFS transporter [Bdellovibrionaceae bacterium]|nr:MFS transporter [Pseudobdellovibrionaceae bacterium]